MGNSTIQLQSVIDYARTNGELDPITSAGGFSQVKSLAIANDAMNAILAEPFNWKWNRIQLAPFYTISWQQDYATVNVTNLGWLEHGVVVDINNTALPKPIFMIWVVRDLERTSAQMGRPVQVCWLPNDQLIQDVWPGANQVFTQPLGAVITPANPRINILDPNGNIQILTTFGTTGSGPSWPAAQSAQGVTTNDGSCVWTVANPKGQGFRLGTLPAQAGNVWQVALIGQAKPPRFTALNQLLNPVPDDMEPYFRAAFVAYSYNHATDPAVKAKFPFQLQLWKSSIATLRGQSDRERDAAGFYPDRGLMEGGTNYDIGPAWPFGNTWR